MNTLGCLSPKVPTTNYTNHDGRRRDSPKRGGNRLHLFSWMYNIHIYIIVSHLENRTSSRWATNSVLVKERKGEQRHRSSQGISNVIKERRSPRGCRPHGGHFNRHRDRELQHNTTRHIQKDDMCYYMCFTGHERISLLNLKVSTNEC